MAMSIEVLDILIIAIGAIIGVTALALLRIVEPTGVFDNAPLMLDLIFLWVGGVGVISEYFRGGAKGNYAT